MDKNLVYWIWLRMHTPASSPIPRCVIEKMGNAETVFRADRETLQECLPDLPEGALDALCDKELAAAEQVLDWCVRNRTGILTMNDPRYPEDLRELRNPPLLLFYYGRLPDFNRLKTVSVVGTRRMSDYGKRLTYEISYGLSKAGVTLVSGMALGIDAVSAAGAIMAGGIAVAVLGSGIGRIYPHQHAKLYSEIARHGVILSEYLPMAEPEAGNFPQRNRIIAALGRGLAVMEAGEHSGALITARFAEELGRKIFVLPGNADAPNSVGPNFLAKQGAFVATSACDILDGLGYEAEAALVPRRVHPPAEDAIRRLSIAFRAETAQSETRQDGEPTEKPRKTSPRGKSKERTQTEAPLPSEEAVLPARSRDEMRELFGEEIADVYFLLPEDGCVFPDELESERYPANKILALLSMMEIEDLVVRLPDGRVRRQNG